MKMSLIGVWFCVYPLSGAENFFLQKPRDRKEVSQVIIGLVPTGNRDSAKGTSLRGCLKSQNYASRLSIMRIIAI
jgi:hypothetical protein